MGPIVDLCFMTPRAKLESIVQKTINIKDDASPCEGLEVSFSSDEENDDDITDTDMAEKLEEINYSRITKCIKHVMKFFGVSNTDDFTKDFVGYKLLLFETNILQHPMLKIPNN
jgi:hypothetical protein